MSPHLSGEKLQDIYYHWADLLFCRRVKYSVYTLSHVVVEVIAKV